MILFDSHCHLDVAEFAADRGAVLARARSAGVTDIVVPGVSMAAMPGLLAFCRSAPGLHAAVGLHPVYLDEHATGAVAALWELALARRPEIVAIGEIGLDYFVATLDPARQQVLFEAQLRLARELDLPVLLHVRRAHDAVLATLRRFRLPRGGICHAFAGSGEQARQYTGLGFLLGFGGAATHERANRLRTQFRELPLSSLVLETDAPDMPPSFLARGARNSPEYLPQIAALLAGLRGIPVEELAAATTANARRVLRLPDDSVVNGAGTNGVGPD